MANERLTEDLVRSHFKDDPLFKSIRLEEQRSSGKAIAKLLKAASKTITLNWAAGETAKTNTIDVTKFTFAADGEQITLELRDSENAQVAVNQCGNEYVKLGVLLVNATAVALRRADTRSWVTLPDGQQVWEDGEMLPGSYQIGVSAGGRNATFPVTLAAGETKLLWIADTGQEFRSAVAGL